jgi:glycosyltransferase involved in cell wall biosynthesis
MLNILFIITKSEIGGAQKWTKEQLDICSKDFNCYLATNKIGWLSKNAVVEDVFFSQLIQSRFSIRYLFLLNEYVKERKIDILISSSANAGIYSRLLKLLNAKIKIIYVSHGWSSIYNGGYLKYLYILIEKCLSWLSDSILCISEYDYKNAVNVIGINKKRLKKISNCIFHIPIESRINKSDKIKILSVSRLSPPKRIDLLLSAVKNIDVELHIIGDGELRRGLEIMSPSNVFFHGEIENFSNFSNFDIFCLISDSEGLPLSAIEAMSAGLPLILSNVGGCSELIHENGCLVENSVKEIQRAIIDSSNQIELYGCQSKILFETRFNLALNNNQYLDYYREILLT